MDQCFEMALSELGGVHYYMIDLEHFTQVKKKKKQGRCTFLFTFPGCSSTLQVGKHLTQVRFVHDKLKKATAHTSHRSYWYNNIGLKNSKVILNH